MIYTPHLGAPRREAGAFGFKDAPTINRASAICESSLRRPSVLRARNTCSMIQRMRYQTTIWRASASVLTECVVNNRPMHGFLLCRRVDLVNIHHPQRHARRQVAGRHAPSLQCHLAEPQRDTGRSLCLPPTWRHADCGAVLLHPAGTAHR
jgi:hypothetical protein